MENYEENLKLENYKEISRADSIFSQYDNYRISYKRRRKPGKSFPVVLTQLLIAAALAALFLLLRFVPYFEPAFEAVKNFMQKNIFENLSISLKSVFYGI